MNRESWCIGRAFTSHSNFFITGRYYAGYIKRILNSNPTTDPLLFHIIILRNKMRIIFFILTRFIFFLTTICSLNSIFMSQLSCLHCSGLSTDNCIKYYICFVFLKTISASTFIKSLEDHGPCLGIKNFLFFLSSDTLGD